MPVNSTDADFPWLDWATVRNAVNHAWDPLNNPHHLICGSTGSGKSYLAVNGILKPMCAMDRVLIVDTKGDDPIVSSIGKEVRELPRMTWYSGMQRRDKPEQNWYRLVTHDDTAQARQQVFRALSRCIKEGNWIVYLDEGVEVVDPHKPNLGLASIVSLGMRKGRSRRVPFIFSTQAPVYIPRWVVDQSSFTWIGRIRDEERQKRLIQIGGLARQDLPYIASLEKRQWLISADPLDMFARTMVA